MGFQGRCVFRNSQTLHAAWEYLYCVRKYLVDETGQEQGAVLLLFGSDPVCRLAAQSGVGHPLSLGSVSRCKSASQSVASSGQSRRPPDGKEREGLIKPFPRQ